jgi:hypothetical protein
MEMNLPAWLEDWTRKLQRSLHDDKKLKLVGNVG